MFKNSGPARARRILLWSLPLIGAGAMIAAAPPPPRAAPPPRPAPGPAPAPAPAPVSAVERETTIDVDNLAEYAVPSLPAHYASNTTAIDNTPASNKIDNRAATLGRVLFYDKQLSTTRTTACSSCHVQAAGFDDPNRFSRGVAGSFTSAHAMRLGNARYWQPGSMFWDRRAATLEAQASQPLVHPVEMGWTSAAGGVSALVARLQQIDYYQELFTLAFGSSTVTEDRIQRALAQFERAMISSSSRWDTAFAILFRRGTPDADLPGFSAQENRGWQLFRAGPSSGGAACGTCHTPPTFALDAASRSNGLDASEATVFKAPSLKNASLSKAFMHDGRFSSLDQVIEHYNSGIANSPSLDPRLKAPNGMPLRLNLTTADKAALVAFLNTLADPALTTDQRFSDPFR